MKSIFTSSSPVASLGNRLSWLSLFLGCDLLFKFIVYYKLSTIQTRPLIPYFVDLTHTFNYGISFGLMQNLPASIRVPLIISLSVLAIGGFIYAWLSRRKRMDIFSDWGFILIIAGALGNFIERVLRGGVTDFFHFHAGSVSFFVNNLADIEISIGVVLLLIGGWREHRRAAR